MRLLNRRCPHAVFVALLLVSVGCDSTPVEPGDRALREGRLIYGLDTPESGWPNKMLSLRSIRPDGEDDRIYHAELAAYLNPSPDGKKVAFVGSGAIRVGDGGGVTLTHVPDDAYEFTDGETNWSPDGSWLAYERGNSAGSASGLGVVSMAGAAVAVNDSFAAAVPCAGGDPIAVPLNFIRWKSNRIEFQWYRCGIGALQYSIKPDGSELVEIVGSSRRWLAPDESRVLYVQGGKPWISDPDGGNAIELITPGEYTWSGWMLPYMWSPDGEFVTLLRTDAGTCDSQPYLIAVDGSGGRPLSDVGCWMFHSWSPDGEWVAATRTDEAVSARIYLFKRDGSDERIVYLGVAGMKVMDVAWLPAP